MDEEDDYKFLKEKLNVDTVVNLRYLHSDNQKLCRKYNLKCVNYKILIFPGADTYLNLETLKEAFRFILDERKAGRKVYFHCAAGSDRTGALASAIMIRESACNKNFDKDILWKDVKATLDNYHFHHIYKNLYKTIKSWVCNFEANQWLCE